VEAGQRSGALNTAGHARDLGRPVLAVPGPVTSAMSVGCHRLLQRDEQPAHLVTSVADILGFCSLTDSAAGTDSDELGGLGDDRHSAIDHDGGQPATAAGRDGLDPSAQTVLDGFPARQPVTEAELSRLSGQPVPAVLAALPILLARGLIAGSREGYRLARKPSAR
jgi:DNA processing protein